MVAAVPGNRAGARGWSRWPALVAVAAALGACRSGTPARGFGSRQLLATRDQTLSFTALKGGVLSYQTSGDGGTADWSLDLATGQAQPSPDAGTASGRFVCAQILTGLIVTDQQTGQKTVIDGVTLVLHCPTDTDPMLAVLETDTTGAVTFWSGPYDQLQLVPLSLAWPIVVSGKSATVLGGTQPGALGIFSIDFATATVTEIVPATLGTAAWASGAPGSGALASSTLVPPQPPGPTLLLHGHYAYERTMSDGSRIMFAGPFSSGPATELALFPVAPYSTVTASQQFFTAVATNVYLSAWQYQDAGAQAASLFVWDDPHQQLLACPLPAPNSGYGIASVDGTRLLVGATPGGPYNLMGELFATVALVTMPAATPSGTGSCALLGNGNVNFAGFSLTGSTPFWMTDRTTLWTAADDGSGARTIGSGDIRAPHFAVGTELEMILAGDLVWVDATDPTNTPHDIAVRAFGTAYDIGGTTLVSEGNWLVTGSDLSGQDGTGNLALVNRSTTAPQLISPEVVDYLVARDPASTDAGPPTLDVVYLVRGRNPSSQDGIWVATIDESTLQN